MSLHWATVIYNDTQDRHSPIFPGTSNLKHSTKKEMELPNVVLLICSLTEMLYKTLKKFNLVF